MKNIILCADDYGQSNSISQAIIDLIKKNRISATSCMTNTLDWGLHAKWLQSFKDSIDIGLHFNLTEGPFLTTGFDYNFITIGDLLLRAYLKKLDTKLIKQELNAQLDSYIDAMGCFPNFIDGHQHIQQLPIIREVLFDVYDERLRATGCYIRSTNNSKLCWQYTNSGYFKILIIQLFGSFAFKKRLTQKKIPFNTDFAGFYNFSSNYAYAQLFLKFLNQVKNNGLIMCHPGSGDDIRDAIAKSRFAEYQYFLSDEFIEACNINNICIGRFK